MELVLVLTVQFAWHVHGETHKFEYYDAVGDWVSATIILLLLIKKKNSSVEMNPDIV